MNAKELLIELIRRPSVNPMGRTDLSPEIVYEHRVTAFLEQQFQALNVEYHRQKVSGNRENIIAYHRTSSPLTFIWEAHQDTVPVDGMIVDPFNPTIRDGKLYGRGSCDVKAGIACMLTAFARLLREKPANSANIILAFNVDEEHTFLGVQEFMKLSPKADFAIVAEPTMLNIVTAHKGVVRWQLETEGRACHSSRPDQGINAVYRMAKVLNAIEEYAERCTRLKQDPLLGPPTLSVGVIAGGVSPNTVPDQCVIQIDRRMLPGESAESVMADFDQYLATKNFPFAIKSKPILACAALAQTPGDHPHLQRLARAIGPHETLAVPYGTDASSIAPRIPAVVFGPGDIAQAHTKDEWIEVSQLDAAVEILFRFACGLPA